MATGLGAGSVLVAVGLRAEFRLLPPLPALRAVCAGGDPARLEALLLAAAAGGGVRGVLSFGISGGLEPGLASGTLLVATAVHLAGEPPLPADPAWAALLTRRCAAAGLLPQLGPLAGADAVVGDPAAKRALRERTGALAVDLESAPAARLAARLKVPFAALRAVADPAGEALPRAAAVGLTPEGEPDIGRVLRALLRRPADLPGLVRAALRTGTAMRALRRAATGGGTDWLVPPPDGRDR